MPQSPKSTNRALWTLQILLSLLFIFAGVSKLLLPPEKLVGPIVIPALFLRAIGVLETLGGLGLVLPSLLRIRPNLTALAATGLVGIMAGATALTIVSIGVLPAVFPFVVGALALAVVFGRGARTPSLQF